MNSVNVQRQPAIDPLNAVTVQSVPQCGCMKFSPPLSARATGGAQVLITRRIPTTTFTTAKIRFALMTFPAIAGIAMTHSPGGYNLQEFNTYRFDLQTNDEL